MAQSQFNPIIGQHLDIGSIRSFAMGHTYMSFPNSSSVILNSPSSILSINNNNKFQVDYTLINKFSLERRSIPMKDNFGDFLTYGDYASNRSRYHYHKFGILFINRSIGLGLNYGPIMSYNYNFNEEVRTRYYATDGEIVSKDPLAGYHTMKSSGTMDALSFALSYGVPFFDSFDINVGICYNYIFKDSINHQFEVDAVSSQINYLSPVESMNLDSGTKNYNYLIGDISIITSNFKIVMAYENSLNKASYDVVEQSYNSELGFFEISIIDSNQVVNYNLLNLSIYKPEKYRFGFSYFPKTYPKTNLAIETEFERYYKNLEQDIFNNVLKWKVGFEYYVNNKLPIRFGFLYANHPLTIIPAETRFTAGSTLMINKKIHLDYGLEYFINQYKYPDLFPVISENRPQYDQVIESTFNVKCEFIYQF